MDSDDAAARFEDHRRLLTGLAYRILGSWTEAEDLVQDLWPRWQVHAAQVESAEGWLRRVTVRAAIDRLRRLQQRRESYPGSWLPEPVSTLPDPAEIIEDRNSVSVGMLVVLETLSPLERAVFVLRQAFGWSHEEISEVLGRSASAVRQLDHRARRHVAERRPRYGADEKTARSTVETFLQACMHGDVSRLLAVLAPDVVLHSDGGGEATAPLRPISGASKVARFMAAIAATPLPEEAVVGITHVNGRPGTITVGPQGPIASMAFDIDESGRITAMYLMAAPSKLTHLAGTVG